MLNFLDIAPNLLDTTIRQFKKNTKPTFSNYFGLAQDYPVKICSNEHLLLIRQQLPSFSRIYFLSDSLEFLRNGLRALYGDVFILNYVHKEANADIIKAILDSGFECLGQYKRYYNVKIKEGLETLEKITPNSKYNENGFEICSKPTHEDAVYLFELINSNFSPYTDYNPSLNEVKLMIEENRVKVNRDRGGSISGYFIFKDTGVKRYQNFWFDKNGMGLLLMKENYKDMLDKNITYTNFWVDVKNKQVSKLHSILGAVFDGTNDITFIKK